MTRYIAILVLSLVISACAEQTRAPREVATRSTGAVGDTMNQTANGVGGAVRAPLRDFNLMHEVIPASLIKAETNPYDTDGMISCEALLTEVGELDVALGPDVDTPSEAKHKDAYDKSASFAAQAALDAVKDTAEGVIPMKSWVRKLSGADNADRRAKQAILAGTTRRAFLKGIGVMRNCTWPAAPLSFEPNKPMAPAQVKPVEPAPAEVPASEKRERRKKVKSSS